MKAAALRWCTIVVFLFLVIGCDGGSGENPNALTVANLQGTYDLNTDAMPGDLVGDDDLNVISAMFEFTADILTTTLMFSGMGPFTLAGTTVTITDSDGNTEDVQVALSDAGNTLTIVTDDGDTLVFTRRDGTGTSNDLTIANLQGAYMDRKNKRYFDTVSLVELIGLDAVMLPGSALIRTAPSVLGKGWQAQREDYPGGLK